MILRIFSASTKFTDVPSEYFMTSFYGKCTLDIFCCNQSRLGCDQAEPWKDSYTLSTEAGFTNRVYFDV